MGQGVASQNQGEAAVTPNAGNSTAGVLTPGNAREQQAANAGQRLANGDLSVVGIGNGNAAPTTTTPDTDNDNDDAPATGGTGGQRNGGSRFRWGNTIGGVLGVAGAYLASNLFGGGWLGTIMFALFAIPAFMMGRSGLGGTLSRWMGEAPAEGQEQTRGTEVQRSQAQGNGTPNQTAAVENNLAERRNELELNARAYAIVSQRGIDERGTNRRFTDANAAELQQQNQQIGRMLQAARNTTDPVQADRILDIADQYFNNLYSQPRNRGLREEMAVEVANLRTAAGGTPVTPVTAQTAAAPANSGVVTDPAIAQYYQQNYGARPGTSFANAQVVGSNLSPEAQQQVLALRQSTNYQPAAAQQGVLEAQRFSGLPDQQQYVVPDYYVAR